MDEDNAEEGGGLQDEDYYVFLNVERTATPEEISAAYKKLSKLYHPDRNLDPNDPQKKLDSETLFHRTKQAYDVLIDPHRRAIYDSLGVEGLKTEGWELVQRSRTPNEIREEYERIARKNEERRLQQKTNPKGQLTVHLNCTDWFDSYEYDDPDYIEEFRLPEVSGISIQQSVEAHPTLRDCTTLSGQANTSNGVGSGNFAVTWRKLLGPRGWVESEFGAGNGPVLSLRAFRTMSKNIFGNAGVTFQATDRGIAPSLQSTLAMQMSKTTMGSLAWRAGMASSMTVSITRDTPSMHFVSMLQFGIPHSFAFVAYSHKLKEGKIRVGVRGGTFGFQVEYGAEKKVSKYSTVSATMSVGVPTGVSLKMRFVRASYTFSFPIRLSEEVVPAAVFYGTVVPVLSWLLIKGLVIDPYLAREKAVEKEKQRQVNQTRIAQKKREAMASISLMQQTFARISSEEDKKNGLVIVVAIYGAASNIETMNPANSGSSSSSGNASPVSLQPSPSRDIPEDCIDVTVPLQCVVQNSKLYLVEGSKCEQPGFYDPCIGEDKKLLIRYKFRGKLHEITVDDAESVTIPRPGHRL
ncbi:dnaJ homolog subfamily C member 11 [Neocloeon triangulifer]|uniref:dnaJ homolog subfamily C member 11 n=1 Tax=Neocloeon triangulifer TaxID=2078957 RepID=UPI00286F56C0|nr:dnaJ homolog subfamily C member 11 [Neocloeon triangulifer]